MLATLTAATTTAASSEATDETLQAKIAGLEQTIQSLRRDNAALRQQLQKEATSPSTSVAVSPEPNALKSPLAGGSYWISSAGKRHNENCRYYKTSKGSLGNAYQGAPCKVCGG